MDANDAVMIAATAVLAVATVFLAAFTWMLRNETRATRRPKVLLRVDYLGADYGELQLVNAGRGAAIDVSATFGPRGGTMRTWSIPALLSGETVNFRLLARDDEEAIGGDRLNATTEAFPVFDLAVSYVDVRGDSHNEEIAVDVAKWWTSGVDAGQLAAFRGPLRPFYELAKKVAEALASIADTK